MLDVGGFLIKFTADIYVSGIGVHGPTSDKTALDEFVRVTTHDFAILAGSRLALVGINDKIPRPNTKINLHPLTYSTGIAMDY